ncbi:MAG: SAF domain-containing protein [Actinomycetes bacterium]
MLNIKFPTPRNPRTYLALGLIVLSLVAAMAISGEAQKTSLVWSASRDLSPGHVIIAGDLVTKQVLLPDNARGYFLKSVVVTGYTVTRAISTSELIPTSSISKSQSISIMRSLPIRVSRNDMPINLHAGQEVDIYSIPLPNNPNPFDPLLVARRLNVESIDQKTIDLGGEIGVVLSVSDTLVLPIINDIENSRVLVVRHAI